MADPKLPAGFVLDDEPPLPAGFQGDRVADFTGVRARVLPKPRQKTRTEQLVEQGAIPASWAIPVEAAEQGLRAARQGLSFGFADELAGLGAGAQALFTGEDPQSAYIAERDRERALSRQFGEDYPAASVLGQVGGGLVTGAAPARAVTQAPGIVRQIGRAIPTGAAAGAVGGLGTSEGTTAREVAGDVGRGAAIGAAVAPVIPAAGAAVGAVRRVLPSRVPVAPSSRIEPTMGGEVLPVGGEPSRDQLRERAVDIVLDTVRRSGSTLDEIQLAVDDALASGVKPEVLADFLGDYGSRRLYTTRALGGEGAQRSLETLGARAEGTAARVSEDVQQATAQRGQSLSQLDARIENRRRMGNSLYQEAYKHGEITDPDTLALVQNPRVASILKKASDRRQVVADLRNETYAPLFRETDQGPMFARVPTVEDLHLLKTSLDDDIQQAYKVGEGQLGKALRDFKNQIVGRLEDEVPAYRKARETYKGDIEVEEALTNGRADILRKPVDELRRDFNALSGAEQDAYRIGAIDKVLQDRIDRFPDTADAARKLWANADMRNRLSLLVRGPDELVRLANQLRREQNIARTNRAVFGGSQTALRETDIGDTVAGALADTATQGVQGAVLGQVQRIIRRAGGITEPVADDIARILTTQGRENISAVINTLRGREKARVIEALNRQRAARTAAGTASQVNGRSE